MVKQTDELDTGGFQLFLGRILYKEAYDGSIRTDSLLLPNLCVSS